MGRRTERSRATIANQQAGAHLRYSEADRRNTEDTLGEMENLLGTEQQFSLEGQDFSYAPYTARYSTDEAIIQAMGGNEGWGHHGMNMRGLSDGNTAQFGLNTSSAGAYAQSALDRANAWLDEAEALARSGDTEGADALKKRAADFLRQANPTAGNTEGAGWATAFRLGGADPHQTALHKLSNPMAQTVGTLVRDARAFGDPNSEYSRDFRETLTARADEAIGHGLDNTRRGIAAGHRQAQRAGRDIGLSRGGARNANAERAIAGRVSERFSSQLAAAETDAARRSAELHGSADQFFLTYRDQFRTSTAAFAQAWLQNTSGIRNQYQDALSQIQLSQATFAQQVAVSHGAAAQQAAELEQASKSRSDQLIMTGIGLVATIATAGIGAAGLAAAAGAAAKGGAQTVNISPG